MKFLLCCFLLLNLSFVKSEEILKSWSDLEKRGNTFFKKKTNEPFTGILKNFYPDGQVQLIDNFKDGMQHGEYISYHQNGEILLKGYFQDGKQHGIWTEFHEDGSLYWNLRYINGVAEDGIFRMFYPNGSVESEVTYRNGKPVTNWLYFDENGKKESVKIYENGKFIYEKILKN